MYICIYRLILFMSELSEEESIKQPISEKLNFNIIGEGSYGCVHKPSLHCSKDTENNIDYTGKISKILLKKDANDEMKSHAQIAIADQEMRHFLGIPELCEPADTEENKSAFKNCKMTHNIYDEDNKLIIPDIKDYSLLIMKNGGVNVYDYLSLLNQNRNEANHIEYKKQFVNLLIGVHNLMLSIKVLLENGLCHNDIHIRNILYNEETKSLNFIDFGLTTEIEELIHQCDNSEYFFAHKIHWWRPFESLLTNKIIFENVKNQDINNRIDIYETDFLNEFDTIYGNSFMVYANQNVDENDIDYLDYTYKIKYKEFLVCGINKFFTHREFVEKYFSRLDIYCLGIVCLQIIKYGKQFIELELFQELFELFTLMVNPDLHNRIEIHHLINKYEGILTEYGIMSRNDKLFENHKLIYKKSMPPLINHNKFRYNIKKQISLKKRNRFSGIKPESSDDKDIEMPYRNRDVVRVGGSSKNLPYNRIKNHIYSHKNKFSRKTNLSNDKKMIPIRYLHRLQKPIYSKKRFINFTKKNKNRDTKYLSHKKKVIKKS